MQNKLVGLMTATAGVFLFFSLNGCANSPRVETIKPTLTIPDAMFQCGEAGTRPKGEVILESEVARYIASLEFANKDCKTRIKEIALIVKCYNDEGCNVDKLAEYMGLVREIKKP